MKNTIIFLAISLLLTGNATPAASGSGDKQPAGSTTINVLITPEMAGLANRWAGEFPGLQGGAKIEIATAGEISNASYSEKAADFGISYGAPGGGLENTWKIIVGREIIVPVMSNENPYKELLFSKGISAEEFAKFITPGSQVWGSVIPEGLNRQAHFYILDDAQGVATVKRFLGTGQLPEEGISFMHSEDIIAAVGNDPFAVGFCKLADLSGNTENSLSGKISFVPIDKNSNGKLDYMENIYNDGESFARGVWIGKYPHTLYSDIYLVSGSQPQTASDIAFVRYLITDGQQAVSASGFSGLVYSERISRLDKFNRNLVNLTLPGIGFNSPVLIIIIASFLLILLLAGALFFFSRNRGAAPVKAGMEAGYFSGESVGVPKGLFFAKSHTWTYMEKEGLVKLGIDDFLQHITGPVTRIELKKPGERIRKGDTVLSLIQQGKQLNIYSPVSGVITERNNLLLSDPSHLNTSPYSSGWIYRIEPANWVKDIQLMEMAETYKTWLISEFTHLKDFLAGSIKVNRMEYEHIVLQDGGVMKDHVLEEFGPEVWEDFQTNFLDKYN
jgi:glycine cleavage system H lipoate-binding protein